MLSPLSGVPTARRNILVYTEDYPGALRSRFHREFNAILVLLAQP